MRTVARLFVVSFLTIISPTAGLVSCSKDAQTPSKQVPWAWRKQFHDASLGNLCMAWNGSRIVFRVTETGPKAGKGDVIAGLNENGRPLNDWRVPGRITGLSLNGKGVKLLAELADGRLLVYEDWEKGGKPQPVKTSSSGAIFSPEGDFIALARGGKDNQGPRVLSPAGKTLWPLPEGGADSVSLIFPFLDQKKGIVRTTSGSLSMSEEGKLLWKAELAETPVGLASSFLEGGLIAVSTAGDQGKIRFYDRKGALKGSAPLPCWSLADSSVYLQGHRRARRQEPVSQGSWRWWSSLFSLRSTRLFSLHRWEASSCPSNQ